MAPASGSEGEYTPSGTSSMNLLTGVVNGLFSFKPAWNFMKGKARQMMVDRGDAIGYPWAARLEELKKYDWAAEVEAVRNKDLTYPDVSGSTEMLKTVTELSTKKFANCLWFQASNLSSLF
jgi:hypothetical protein